MKGMTVVLSVLSSQFWELFRNGLKIRVKNGPESYALRKCFRFAKIFPRSFRDDFKLRNRGKSTGPTSPASPYGQ